MGNATPQELHVAFIRGINVGRAKRVAMKDLSSLFEALGARQVRTVLNSGNVLFAAPSGRITHQAIEQAMQSRLQVQARTILLSAADLGRVIRENPLTAIANQPARLLAAFLADAPTRKLLQSLQRQDWSPGRLAVGSKAGYLWCPDGIATSRLMIEVARATGDGITSRNWSTVQRIYALLRAQEQQ